MQLSYSIEEVSKLTGIGKTKIYQTINAGDLKAKKFGKRTIILKSDLDDFLNSLTSYQSITHIK